jgi:nucleoside-diphosphate-sugar epimerase
MHVLVTGGTGFTGSALVLDLLRRGHMVRSLDYQSGIRHAELLKAGAEIVTGTITDPDVVQGCMHGIDFVFHLAAAFRESNLPDKHYHDVNVTGTRNVLEGARKNNVIKVVYCSTEGVHGHIDNPPADENSPIAPADTYQETKYAGELVAREYIEDGVNVTILRPTSIYGPGDPGRFLMIYKWVERGVFPMFGSGTTFYHPVYIDNLVQAFLLTMDPERGKGETYLIGDEEYCTIKELVRKVAEAMNTEVTFLSLPLRPLIIAGHICEMACKPFGVLPPLFPRRVNWYRQVRAFRIDKAVRELGYRPSVDTGEGLRRTGEWYQKGKYL